MVFRWNRFRRKGDPVDSATDILGKVQVGALADDMAETDIGEAVVGGSDPDCVEKIGIALDVDGKLGVLRQGERNAAPAEFFRYFGKEPPVLRGSEIHLPIGSKMVLPIEYE
jgi:hypothetical protein